MIMWLNSTTIRAYRVGVNELDWDFGLTLRNQVSGSTIADGLEAAEDQPLPSKSAAAAKGGTPPGEVRRPDGRGTSVVSTVAEGKVPKVNQLSSGSSPFEMTYSRHRLRATTWAALIASDASRLLGASPLML